MAEEKKEQKIVPIVSGEVHLQNIIPEKKCYICKKEFTSDMLLLHGKGKEMVFACSEHAGVIKEFVRQYKHIPLGWTITEVKKSQNNDPKPEKRI